MYLLIDPGGGTLPQQVAGPFLGQVPRVLWMTMRRLYPSMPTPQFSERTTVTTFPKIVTSPADPSKVIGS